VISVIAGVIKSLAAAREARWMKWIFFAVGLVLGAIGAFATVVYAHMNKFGEPDDNILFAEKDYFEGGDLTVGISGTLTGPGLDYPNNTYNILCYKERGECWTSNITRLEKIRSGGWTALAAHLLGNGTNTR
jgi:hypothetical protein